MFDGLVLKYHIQNTQQAGNDDVDDSWYDEAPHDQSFAVCQADDDAGSNDIVNSDDVPCCRADHLER